MPMLFELKQERQVALNANEAILQRAEKDGGRNLTAEEASLFQANMQEVDRLTPRIASIESKNTFLTPFTNGLSASGFSGPSSVATQIGNAALTHEDPRASAFRASFAGWVSNALTAIGGGTPAMEASPSGVVSVGSGTGLDSIAITVPTEILQYLPTYFALDSFGLAGATVFYTDHTRPLTKPVMSAGAADSVYAENAAPGTSQPFGLSGFTFGGVKYARLVLATYESLRLLMQKRVRDEISRVGLLRSQIVFLDALLKLRQVCCDPRLLPQTTAKGEEKPAGSAKLARLMEMLPELLREGRRIILFSQFTSMLDLINPELDALAIAYVEIRGETQDRKTPVRQFQAGEVPLILISLKAGGTGLNLTAADTVILYDPWWNPAVEAQAIDRAHRIGQTKPVFVHRLIAKGTIEEKILGLQDKKRALAAMLWEGDSATQSKLTETDIEYLLG